MSNVIEFPKAKRRLLLVEDFDLLRMATARVLRGYGWDVIEVATAAEAKAHYGTVDAVLTDWQPSGPEVVSLCGKPVVIYTGDPQDPKLEGVDPSIPIFEKPVDQEQIHDTLMRVGGF